MVAGALAYFNILSEGFAMIFIMMFILMLIREELLIRVTYIVLCLFMFSDAYLSQTYTVFDLGLITCFMFIGFLKIYHSKSNYEPIIKFKK